MDTGKIKTGFCPVSWSYDPSILQVVEYGMLYRKTFQYPDGGARLYQPSSLLHAFYIVDSVASQRERAQMEAARNKWHQKK